MYLFLPSQVISQNNQIAEIRNLLNKNSFIILADTIDQSDSISLRSNFQSLSFFLFEENSESLSKLFKISNQLTEKREKIKGLYRHVRCQFCYSLFDQHNHKPNRFKNSSELICGNCFLDFKNSDNQSDDSILNIEPQFDLQILKSLQNIYKDKNLPECGIHPGSFRRFICLDQNCVPNKSLHCHFCSKIKHASCKQEFDFRVFYANLKIDLGKTEKITDRISLFLNMANIHFPEFYKLQFWAREINKNWIHLDCFFIDENLGKIKSEIQQNEILVIFSQIHFIDQILIEIEKIVSFGRINELESLKKLVHQIEDLSSLNLETQSIKFISENQKSEIISTNFSLENNNRIDKINLHSNTRNYFEINKILLSENQSLKSANHDLAILNSSLKSENNKLILHNQILLAELQKLVWKTHASQSSRGLSASKSPNIHFDFSSDFLKPRIFPNKFQKPILVLKGTDFPLNQIKCKLFPPNHRVNILIIFDNETDCHLIQSQMKESGLNMQSIAIKSDRIQNFEFEPKSFSSALVLSKKHNCIELGKLLLKLLNCNVNIVMGMWSNHSNFYPQLGFQGPLKPGSSDSQFQNFNMLVPDHPLFEGITTLTDPTNFKYRIISELSKIGVVECIAEWQDHRPLVAIRFDLKGLVTAFGFSIGEQGSLDGLKLILNALRFTR